MKYLLFIIFAFICNTGIAQKKVKADDILTLAYKITKNECGRSWARGIKEWRHSCFSIIETNKCDTIYMYIDLIPWEASYSELIQVGDSSYGFSKDIHTGECYCEAEEGLRALHDILHNSNTYKQQKSRYAIVDGKNYSDLAPIKVITIYRRGNVYTYDSERVYIDSECCL